MNAFQMIIQSFIFSGIMFQTAKITGSASLRLCPAKHNRYGQRLIYIGDIVKSDMAGNFPYITTDGEF
jgi:hypothetical protein